MGAPLSPRSHLGDGCFGKPLEAPRGARAWQGMKSIGSHPWQVDRSHLSFEEIVSDGTLLSSTE